MVAGEQFWLAPLGSHFLSFSHWSGDHVVRGYISAYHAYRNDRLSPRQQLSK